MAALTPPLGTYTTRATRVVGWGLLGVLVLTAGLSLIRTGVDLGFLAWLLLLAAVVWVGIVRPRIDADQEGVHVRNLLRDRSIPWARVAGFGDRWALEVFTREARIASWAIPARRDLRGALRTRRDEMRARGAGGVGPPPTPSQDSERMPRIDAGSVKDSLETARLQWRRGDYGRPEHGEGAGPVVTRWPWEAWLPLVAGVLAVVLTSR